MKRIDRNRMEDGFSQSAFPTKVGVLRGGGIHTCSLLCGGIFVVCVGLDRKRGKLVLEHGCELELHA